MQPSEQQPAENTRKQATEETAEQVSQPLYEFPPYETLLNGVPLISEQAIQKPAPITHVLPAGEASGLPDVNSGQMPLDEAVRGGLLYPPPPSFYQNMPEPSEYPLFPAQSASVQPAYAYPVYAPQGQMYQGGIQTFPPPSMPPFMLQPAAKKSRTWIWIVVTTLSIVLLASCGLCGWGFYSLFNTTFQQVTGSISVVDDYYANLESHNYTTSYSDLAPQGQISDLTLTQFTQKAQALDQQYGSIISYIPGQPAFVSDPNTGPDLSHVTITVDIKRTKLSYTVLLTVKKLGESWKVTDFDRI